MGMMMLGFRGYREYKQRTNVEAPSPGQMKASVQCMLSIRKFVLDLYLRVIVIPVPITLILIC
jgi:hypothetical protein